MKKKSLILLAILVLVFTVITPALVGCKKVDIVVDANNLQVFMGQINANEIGHFTIGTRTYTGDGIKTTNKLDIAKMLGNEYSFTLEKYPTGVSMNGSVLTFDEAENLNGKHFQIKCLNSDEIPKWAHFDIVEKGINVSTVEQFTYAATNKIGSLNGPVCLLNSIKLKKANSLTMPDPDEDNKTIPNILVVNDIYGNGFTFDAEDIVKSTWKEDGKGWGTCAFDMSSAKGVKLQDFKITGKVIPEGESLNFNDITAYGTLIQCTPGAGSRADITLRNLIIENSHKNVYFNNCDVVMDGCVVQNASDSTVSIETHPNGGTNVTLRNCTIANSMTAGVVMWGYTKVEGKDPKDYVDLKVEGFLDIFNWKSDKETKLMPATEGMADMVNNSIGGELDKEKYQPYFYIQDGTRYLHLGMIVLATTGLKENRAVLNGKLAVDNPGEKIDGTNLEIKDFPLPGFAKAFCKTCLMVGYGTNEKLMDIKPSSKMSDNKNFYQDMYWGRK